MRGFAALLTAVLIWAQLLRMSESNVIEAGLVQRREEERKESSRRREIELACEGRTPNSVLGQSRSPL